jgi:exopolysaccharide biosynthesis predicted pyruvyltransferase EpsI
MFMHHLNLKIETAIKPLLAGKSRHICVIDPPGHSNVGDNAIFLGELDFIFKHFPDARVSFYDLNSHSDGADDLIEEATIILLHGGGNFGDIWPDHQALRMRIIERFLHKPIIQLPQSIYFNDSGEMKRTAALIDRHRAFHLIVRDMRSKAYADARFGCPVLLVPDMAFAMRPIARKEPSFDYLCLLRTDKEAISDHTAIVGAVREVGGSVEIADWLDAPRTLVVRADQRLGWWTRKHPHWTAALRSMALRIRRAYAEQRVSRGIELLSQGRNVVTDRLHGHIMCTLLEIPHFVFDSFDGKISALNETWLHRDPYGLMISSPSALSQHLSKKSS